MRIFPLVAAVCVVGVGSVSQSAADPGGTESAAKNPGLVARHAEIADIAVGSIEGKPMHGLLVVKPLLRGEQMTMLALHYQPGAKAPLHTHSHESLIYVVSGRVRTSIGDDVYVLGPGDAARHPAGVLHTVEALVESTVIEIKSPPPDLTSVIRPKSSAEVIRSLPEPHAGGR